LISKRKSGSFDGDTLTIKAMTQRLIKGNLLFLLAKRKQCASIYKSNDSSHEIILKFLQKLIKTFTFITTFPVVVKIKQVLTLQSFFKHLFQILILFNRIKKALRSLRITTRLSIYNVPFILI